MTGAERCTAFSQFNQILVDLSTVRPKIRCRDRGGTWLCRFSRIFPAFRCARAEQRINHPHIAHRMGQRPGAGGKSPHPKGKTFRLQLILIDRRKCYFPYRQATQRRAIAQRHMAGRGHGMRERKVRPHPALAAQDAQPLMCTACIGTRLGRDRQAGMALGKFQQRTGQPVYAKNGIPVEQGRSPGPAHPRTTAGRP